MFRLYSKGCEYAIRAFLCLAAGKEGFAVTAKDVCRKARIPEHFTRKIFQSLVKGGYLKAVPGNGGGYRLRKHPDDVCILEIIKAVDGKNTFERCILGASTCSRRRPCLLHDTWEASRQNLLARLASKRLSEFVRLYPKSS